MARSIDQKTSLLNKVMNVLRYCRMTMDFVEFIHSREPYSFEDIMKKLDKPSLVLLTYDLSAIGDAIKIPEGTFISNQNGSFFIEYTSPVCSSASSDKWS